MDYFAEPYLVSWKLKTKDWQKVSQESLDIGTVIDGLVQLDINQDNIAGPATDNEKLKNCWRAWLKFRRERPDVYERLVKYKANMQRELILGDLVGHPDFILDDEVIDLKTSKQVSKSHWMQTAQYANMWNETMGFYDPLVGKIKKISVLRVCKLTGEYEYRTLEEPFVSFWQRKFQARLECYMEEKEFAEMMRVKLEEEKLS